jgi:hypothetical protein
LPCLAFLPHFFAMNPSSFAVTRRQFIRTSLAATAGLAGVPLLTRAAAEKTPDPKPADGFSFVLLGDLHYDKLEHHDFDWLAKNHPNDRSQIENYSRITRDVMPGLFATVRDTIAEINRGPGPHVAFVLHVGDLVEGLCGSEELSLRQNMEALSFVRGAGLGVPFVYAKGNHDVTGDGAVAAFGHAIHPFLTEQLRALTPGVVEQKSARYTIERGNAQLVVFDAYDPASLEWFEAIAARRNAEHLLFLVHPPVVPYGARATWHIFSSAREKAKREKLLTLLGDQHAFVLGGHIHKFNSLVRRAGRGRFVQLALSSVINEPKPQAKMVLTGVGEYSGDQIRVEPNFSPETEKERRAVYEAEWPSVTAFEYADLPGYAIVTVAGPDVTAQVFSGTTRERWRMVKLTQMIGARV